MEIQVREARPDDAAFILEMTLAAVNWDPRREPLTAADVLARPEIAHYATDWPRPGDLGVIAEQAGRRIGAAWLRRFTAADPGYGFVAEDIPEFSIGVVPEWRGQGVGRRLAEALIELAERGGVSAMSLSVEHANGAVHLYETLGFREVARDEGARTMLLRLPSGAQPERRMGNVRGGG